MAKINKKSFEQANQRGIFKEYQFYLVLKAVSIPGYLPKGQYLQLIQDRIKEYNSHNPYKKLPTSKSQISRLINKCEKLSFLRRNKTGIYLNSYRKVFASLEAGVRAGRYDDNTFIEDFAYSSIKSKLQQIRRATKKAHPHKKRERDEFETFLSCWTIAKMFGYKSKSQAYELRKYFESLGLLKVTRLPARYLGAAWYNKHFPGSFILYGKFFYQPASEIQAVL